MIIEISVGIIAFCVLILTIYLVITLISVRRVLDNVNVTMSEVRKPLLDSSEKIARITANAADLAGHFGENLKSFDPFFRGISSAGHRFENLTYMNQEKTNNHSEQDNSHTLLDIISLLAISLELWQKSKKRS